MSNFRPVRSRSPYPIYTGSDDYLRRRAVVEREQHEAFAEAINRAILLPSFRVHLNGTNQTGVATGTQTKIAFSSIVSSGAAEGYDDFGYWSTTTYRYTPQIAGVYALGLQARFVAATANIYTHLLIYKNGVTGPVVAQARAQQSTATVPVATSCSGQIRLDGRTDYVEFYCVQDSGADQVISGNTTHTVAWGCKLADY